MDLGIKKGRKAFVCASSQRAGFGLRHIAGARGCEVWINGRTASKLEKQPSRLKRKTGNRPHILVADITTRSGPCGHCGGVSRSGHSRQQQRGARAWKDRRLVRR